MVAKSHPESLLFLDGLRGFAALYVMIGHARWLLWEGFHEGFSLHPELYNGLEKLVAYSTLLVRYGHQMVMLFFVLSGFVIHLRYSKALHNGSSEPFDLIPFLIRRLKRIYPPLVFALLL